MANKINFKLRRRFLDNIPAIPNSKIDLRIEDGKLKISIPITAEPWKPDASVFEFRKTSEKEPLPIQYNELFLEPIVTKSREAGANDEYSGRVKISAVFVVDTKKPIEAD